ncbi:hypothetical protein FSP39_008193 [Pinctada imbricata]|uniref:Metallothionein n=1 Tax=Pinctada imbricata TaxID=66713 RepID=A0AA89BWF8_PINIB|nr:hypothetical protein FSP39_008193 [Pinctada imbricata]
MTSCVPLFFAPVTSYCDVKLQASDCVCFNNCPTSGCNCAMSCKCSDSCPCPGCKSAVNSTVNCACPAYETNGHWAIGADLGQPSATPVVALVELGVMDPQSAAVLSAIVKHRDKL